MSARDNYKASRNARTLIAQLRNPPYEVHWTGPDGLMWTAATVIEELLALAIQYARECGECSGTGTTRDGSDCDDCADIRVLIKGGAP